jgi:cell division protein FtsL
MLAIGLCASVCLLVSVGLVAQKAKLMSLGYELSGLQAELQSLEKERAQLQLALVTARSPRQIEQKAIAQLGMVKPGNVEYLFLEGASGSKDEIQVADNTEHQVRPVAVVGSWFAENWPRWGRAEASSR